MKTLPTFIKNTKRMMDLLNIDGYNCPLFIQTGVEEEFEKFIDSKNRILTGDLLIDNLPFDTFRLYTKNIKSIRNINGDSWTTHNYVWVNKVKNLDNFTYSFDIITQLTEKIIHIFKDGEIKEVNFDKTATTIKQRLTYYRDKTGKTIEEERSGPDIFVRDILLTQKDLLKISHKIDPQTVQSVEFDFSLGILSIRAFINKLNKLENHIVEVTPAKEDRELEWLEGRKHYVVLSNHQAADRGMMIGTPWGEDSHKTRIAHARRGHVRFLRSDKFKQKQGQKIFVRDTWVGPKEWKDNSLTTYKLVGV